MTYREGKEKVMERADAWERAARRSGPDTYENRIENIRINRMAMRYGMWKWWKKRLDDKVWRDKANIPFSKPNVRESKVGFVAQLPGHCCFIETDQTRRTDKLAQDLIAKVMAALGEKVSADTCDAKKIKYSMTPATLEVKYTNGAKCISAPIEDMLDFIEIHGKNGYAIARSMLEVNHISDDGLWLMKA